MHKGIKNISVFILWFAGLVIFSHSVIPHTHYFNSGSEHSQKENHKGTPSEKESFHCHAFNDLTIDNTFLSINKPVIKKLVLTISPGVVNYPQLFEIHKGDIIYLKRNDFPLALVPVQITPIRGSPSIA